MKSNRFVINQDTPWVEIRHTEENDQHYKKHFHSELFIAAVLRGSTRVEIQGVEYRAGKGSLVTLGPQVVHRCTPTINAHSYVVAYIDAPWCRALQHDLFGAAAPLSLPQPPVFNDSGMFAAFLELAELLEADGCTLEKSEKLTQFVAELLQRGNGGSAQPLPAQPRMIAAVKKELARSLADNITLQEIAGRLGYNPYYLLRSFKKSCAITPHEYRLNLRVEKARQLLRAGMPPADVAAETGFVDQSHLHRTFRQFAAATPGQFRQRSRP